MGASQGEEVFGNITEINNPVEIIDVFRPSNEIIKVTDNPFTLVECAHDEELCKVQKCCPTKRTLIALHNKIQQFIEETTLATIVKDAQLIKPNFEDSKYEIAHLS